MALQPPPTPSRVAQLRAPPAAAPPGLHQAAPQHPPLPRVAWTRATPAAAPPGLHQAAPQHPPLPRVAWMRATPAAAPSELLPAALQPSSALVPPCDWAPSRRARNRATHAAHGNGPKGQGRPPAPAPAAPPALRLRPEDWPVPVRDPGWADAADGVLFLGNSPPTPEQLTALPQSPHQIFLVCLRRPPPAPAAPGPASASPPPAHPTPRQFSLPLQGARLLVRPAYAFCSPAAASTPLPGEPPTAGADHSMPDASSAATPSLARARDLSAAAADAVLLALELEERWAPDWAATVQGGPRALLKLLSALLPAPHGPLDVFALATRGELLGQRVLRATARIPAAALSQALRLSGTGGLIVRPFRVDGPSPYSVVWVPGDLSAGLLAAASFPGACGLVANARGLGVRVLAADYPAAYAALRQAPAPAPKLYFELAGAPLGLTAEPLASALRAEGWTATPLRTFVRSGRRCWVLQAESMPEFSLLRTEAGLATLQPARDRPPRPSTAWTRLRASAPVAPPAPAPASRASTASPSVPLSSAWAQGPPADTRTGPQRPPRPSPLTPNSPSPFVAPPGAPSQGVLQRPAVPGRASSATAPAFQGILQRLTALEQASPATAPPGSPSTEVLQRLTAVEQQLARVPNQLAAAIAAALAPIQDLLTALVARLDRLEAISHTTPARPPRSSDDDEEMATTPDRSTTRKRGTTGSPPGARKRPGGASAGRHTK